MKLRIENRLWEKKQIVPYFTYNSITAPNVSCKIFFLQSKARKPSHMGGKSIDDFKAWNFRGWLQAWFHILSVVIFMNSRLIRLNVLCSCMTGKLNRHDMRLLAEFLGSYLAHNLHHRSMILMLVVLEQRPVSSRQEYCFKKAKFCWDIFL